MESGVFAVDASSFRGTREELFIGPRPRNSFRYPGSSKLYRVSSQSGTIGDKDSIALGPTLV